MEIGLSPREIQTRVRAGASLAEVAEAAGVPPERVEPFAAPVLAEREHIATLALAAAVRRRGESAAHRTLSVAVTDRLGRRGIPDDQVSWDAWRREDRRWTLVARYELGAVPREAVFHYNQQSRISEPANDDARWLTGELSALPGAPDDPTEPTIDLNDELALVRALREPVAETTDEETVDRPPLRLHHGRRDEPVEHEEIVEPDAASTPEATPHVPLPRSQATPQDIGQEIEAQLSNYSSGNDTVGLDLLYDLLDGPATESAEPVVEPEQPPLDFDDELNAPAATIPASELSSPQASRNEPEAKPSRLRRRLGRKKGGSAEQPPAEQPAAPTSAATAHGPSLADGDAVGAEGNDEPTVQVATTASTDRIPPIEAPAAQDQAAGIPSSAELSDSPPTAAPEPPTDATAPETGTTETGTTGEARPDNVGSENAPASEPVTEPAERAAAESEDTVQMPRPRKRRKRAAVPTWDEIMFGGDSDS